MTEMTRDDWLDPAKRCRRIAEIVKQFVEDERKECAQICDAVQAEGGKPSVAAERIRAKGER